MFKIVIQKNIEDGNGKYYPMTVDIEEYANTLQTALEYVEKFHAADEDVHEKPLNWIVTDETQHTFTCCSGLASVYYSVKTIHLLD